MGIKTVSIEHYFCDLCNEEMNDKEKEFYSKNTTLRTPIGYSMDQVSLSSVAVGFTPIEGIYTSLLCSNCRLKILENTQEYIRNYFKEIN